LKKTKGIELLFDWISKKKVMLDERTLLLISIIEKITEQEFLRFFYQNAEMAIASLILPADVIKSHKEFGL